MRMLDAIQLAPEIRNSIPDQSLPQPPNRSEGLEKADIKRQVVNLGKSTNLQVNLKVFELVARILCKRTLEMRVGRVCPVTDIGHQILGRCHVKKSFPPGDQHHLIIPGVDGSF